MNQAERSRLKGMFGGKCAYCGCDLGVRWHADHVEPIYRIMKYARDAKTGYGKLIPTGECYYPDRDTVDNLFPCCGPCNIHKGVSSIEGWRRQLEDLTGVLQRNYPTYRHAVRFQQVAETPAAITFWFEKCIPDSGKNR